jgi:Cu(I)/Ag(I) efflux system membrane fusion protein
MKSAAVLLIALILAIVPAWAEQNKTTKPEGAIDYWTCTMHPSVHLPAPGKCPICSMDLVPVMKSNAPTDAAKPASATHEFVVPPERQQQIGVTYAAVERKTLRHSIRSVGIVAPNLEKHWAFVARVEGYVQQLFVTSPGQLVEKDAPLLSIYSPDLLTTEREFVSLLRMRDEARSSEARIVPLRLIEAAKSRLRQWNMTDAQLSELEKSRKPDQELILRSPFRGVVQEVAAHQGVGVKIGDHLVDIADLSVVWVWAEFYENELSMLRQGQRLAITSNSLPNENLEGEIAVIDPFIDPVKRTAKVRIDVANSEFKLRPGMFVNAEIGMEMGEALTLPVSAVMPTGVRNIVFVDKGAGKLEPRAVELGVKYGDSYEVKRGVQAGERVVASANFLIDAEAKVQGALKSFGAEAGDRTPHL